MTQVRLRLLAFSDLHRDRYAAQAIVDASEDADIVIGCGDFASQGIGTIETLDILDAISGPIILVHGNHDTPQQIADFCAGRAQGHYLHGSGVAVAGREFFGLGGEIPARNTAPWNVSESEASATRHLATLPDHAILVTHTPPLGVADLQRDGTHKGSAAIRSTIVSRAPQLCLCGHIHNAWGMSGRIGGTHVHNLGPGINWFDI